MKIVNLLSAIAFMASVAGTAPSLAADELPTYQLSIKAGRFTPETIDVVAGKKFVLVVKNEGPGSEEFESHDLKREKVIPEGKQIEIPIGPLKAGTYKFVGEYHEATAKGQILAK